jgi:hypothetical protein
MWKSRSTELAYYSWSFIDIRMYFLDNFKFKQEFLGMINRLFSSETRHGSHRKRKNSWGDTDARTER